MSSRIHRALGWGMPWADFLARQRLSAEPDAVTAALEARFNQAEEAGLSVPSAVVKDLLRGKAPAHPPILERHLLATEFTQFGKVDPATGRANDLYTLVWNGDTVVAILFYPNLSCRRQWYRRDDAIDYAFERWAADGRDADLTTVLRWSRYGHHPWTQYLMLTDGTPIAWNAANIAAAWTEVPAAVPSEIRWYLDNLGILDKDAVNTLRPALAQWWA